MPADAAIVEEVRLAIQRRGGHVLEVPSGDAPNPFALAFSLDDKIYRVLVYVRRLTPQQGENTDHGRPEGEWHTQMLFDDSQRGAGVRNYLATRQDYITVLFGYASIGDDTVIAAWDAGKKAEYGYSRSLQIKDDTLEQAVKGGVAQQEVRGGEVVVAFRPEFLPEYLDSFPSLHSEVVPGDVGSGPEQNMSTMVAEDSRSHNQRSRRVVDTVTYVPAPEFFGSRERRPNSGSRAVRDVRFKAFISDRYEACAICGVTAPPLLEAAHIIPVSDERSSDHPSNGILLCRNCHRLFDNGFLLITPEYAVEVGGQFRSIAPADAEQYSVPSRQRLKLPALPIEYMPDREKLRYVYENRPR